MLKGGNASSLNGVDGDEGERGRCERGTEKQTVVQDSSVTRGLIC